MSNRCLRAILAGLVVTSGVVALASAVAAGPSSASGAVPPCTSREVTVAVGWGPGGEAGNDGVPFYVINTSSTACSLHGFATLRIFTAATNRHAISVRHATYGVYAAVMPATVVIRPDAVASFGLNYVDVLNQQDPNGPSCTAQTVNVTLPGHGSTSLRSFAPPVDFNICWSGFAVGVTAIQSGGRPKLS
jgi:hypothetical protein